MTHSASLLEFRKSFPTSILEKRPYNVLILTTMSTDLTTIVI